MNPSSDIDICAITRPTSVPPCTAPYRFENVDPSAARNSSIATCSARPRPLDVLLIRTHPIRHDPTRQHGALAYPTGRPNRINAA
jgi:hypothetical protein